MAKPSLTIIIPAYNVSDTLVRCVESVISQDYPSWQAIIVDDGSRDDSLAKAKLLASRDSRITVVHKKNGGLSDARNYALDMLFGVISPSDAHPIPATDYVTFIDSDDYILPATLSSLMDELAIHPEYDILEYSATLHQGSDREEDMTLPCSIYTCSKDYWLDGEGYRHTYAWNKIYKSRIFLSGIRFMKGRIFEDAWMLPDILNTAPVISTTSKGRYIYTDNPKGITHTADKSADSLAQLLHAQLRALSLLDIDLTKPSLAKAEARLYLALCNQQTTLQRLGYKSHAPLLPPRLIPLSAGISLREIIKIIFYNISFFTHFLAFARK